MFSIDSVSRLFAINSISRRLPSTRSANVGHQLDQPVASGSALEREAARRTRRLIPSTAVTSTGSPLAIS
jgi:hypothetical protein